MKKYNRCNHCGVKGNFVPYMRGERVCVPCQDQIREEESKSYKIVRMFRDDSIRSRTIKRGLTLVEAQEHCQDPETSSSTCNEPVNVQRTQLCGDWFDAYTEE